MEFLEKTRDIMTINKLLLFKRIPLKPIPDFGIMKLLRFCSVEPFLAT